MRVRGWGIPFAVAALASLALSAPGGAVAATVVNGDFESGNLAGWNVYRSAESGGWFAYKGAFGGGDPIAKARGRKFPQPPPQGTYAATSDEVTATTMILSQEIALGAGLNHRLSLLAYYNSEVPIAVPSPDSFAVGEQLGGQANQQFRIDVMRAGSPLQSLDPADVLHTIFRTQPGAPLALQPTWLTADLGPFAGQTVRLRIANAANEELFTAGVDAVAVESTRPGERPPPLGSNRFKLGKVKLNQSNGTAILPVEVPGPGNLTAKGKPIKRVTVKAAKEGTVKLRLKPTRTGQATLEQKHKLRAKVAVTFDPVGGTQRTATIPVTFKLKAPTGQQR
ncbi:MAG TPA: hypothetical protein VFI03_06285 [Solirubrobacterales bacterium]|nr:hypothetical protein [Solirubrobacterales bacterium]